MTPLSLLQRAVTEQLNRNGIPAVSAFPEGRRPSLDRPLVAVSLKELEAEGAGFQNYLGSRYSPERQVWEELYGQRVKALFSFSLYSPRSYGEAGCVELGEGLAERLRQEAPAGLGVRSLSWGPIQHDQSCNCYLRKGEALCEGLLYSVKEEGGSFLNFEVRGGMIP